MKKKILLFLLMTLFFVPTFVKAEVSDYEYEDYYDGSGIAITKYKGSESDVTIPSTIDGKKVVNISYNAFLSNDKIRKVTLPNTTKHVSAYAFYDCPNLTQLILNEGLESMADNIIQDTGVKNLNIPASVTRIIGNPFANNASLESVTVSPLNKNFTVYNGALYTFDKKTLLAYPPSLKEENFDIPVNTVEIAKYAFSSNQYLKHITVPKTVDLINNYAFSNLQALEVLTINATLQGMGGYAISENPKLKEVDFSGGEALWFSKYTFYELPLLEKLILPSTIEELKEDWIRSCNPNLKYDIPNGLTEVEEGHYTKVSKVNILPTDYNYDYAKEVLRLVNIEREKEQLSPLKLDYELEEYSMLRSVELTAYFSHTRPNGSDALNLNKVSGENIAAGAGSNDATPEQVVDDWMNSPTHRSNILNSKFKSIGIGCVNVGTVHYWTQLFSYDESENEEIKSGVIPIDKIEIQIRNSLIDYTVLFEGPNETKILGIAKTIEPYAVDLLNKGWEGHTVPLSFEDVTFESENENIFTVSKDAVLYGKSVGTANLKVDFQGIKKEVPIKVVESITVPEKVILKVGETYQIPVTYNPPEAKDKYTIYWGSSISYFYCDENTGFVRAVAPGTATVYVNFRSGYTAKCEITVVDDYLKGDLNFNGEVTVSDAVEALYYFVGSKELNDKVLLVGDFNNDKNISVTDAIEILRIFVSE